MPLFSKFEFKWREPREFVEKRDSIERKALEWWHQVLGVAVSMVLLLFLWFLATLSPKKDPPTFELAFLLAFLFGVFIVYIVPWMIRLCPVWIGLTQTDLRMVRGNSARSVKWHDVEFFDLREGRDFPILQLLLRKGGELEIGLDSSVRPDDVRLLLRDVGVLPANREQSIDGKPDTIVS